MGVWTIEAKAMVENINLMKGLEAKGPFLGLDLQVRFKRAYQTPINYSLLWHVKYYLNSSSNYLKIILESNVVLTTKLVATNL